MRIAAARRAVLEWSQARDRVLTLKLTRRAAGAIGRQQALALGHPPLLQLLNALLNALHHKREPLVTEPMGVAETR